MKRMKRTIYIIIIYYLLFSKVKVFLNNKVMIKSYSAFHVLQFGQNLQAKAISLTSDPAASVHVVPQSQN